MKRGENRENIDERVIFYVLGTVNLSKYFMQK